VRRYLPYNLEPNLSTRLDLEEDKIESDFFNQQNHGKKKQAIDRFISQTSCWHYDDPRKYS
jgi:hypothetical protein